MIHQWWFINDDHCGDDQYFDLICVFLQLMRIGGLKFDLSVHCTYSVQLIKSGFIISILMRIWNFPASISISGQQRWKARSCPPFSSTHSPPSHSKLHTLSISPTAFSSALQRPGRYAGWWFGDFASGWMWTSQRERRQKGKVSSWCCRVTLGEVHRKWNNTSLIAGKVI